MLRARVIPIVLIDGFSVLKTINFSERRNLGSPVTVVRTYNTRNVDELIILDIDASKQNRSIDIFTIRDISEDCFMPLTVGGGIKSVSDIESCLSNGADKVSINTAALQDPGFVERAASIFGSQCIVVSLDIAKGEGGHQVVSSVSKEYRGNLQSLIKMASNAGAGEILLNSVDKDGTLQGPDLDLIRVAAECTKVPIIYTGGIAAPSDCSRVIRSGASAVAASSIFHFSSITPKDCKLEMQSSGIPVRLDLETSV